MIRPNSCCKHSEVFGWVRKINCLLSLKLASILEFIYIYRATSEDILFFWICDHVLTHFSNFFLKGEFNTINFSKSSKSMSHLRASQKKLKLCRYFFCEASDPKGCFLFFRSSKFKQRVFLDRKLLKVFIVVAWEKECWLNHQDRFLLSHLTYNM